MLHTAGNRLVKNGVMWLVIAVSLGLLTPWGIAHRQSLQPKFALIAIVFGTLAGALFFVNALLTTFSTRGGSARGGWKAAILPLCYAISCVLLALTFLWTRNPSAQNYALGGAALFMITAAVLQRRLLERSSSE